MKGSQRLLLALTAIALILALAVAGCGGSKPAEAPKDAKAAAPAAPAKEEAKAPAKEADKFPTKPVNVVIPYATGGGSDVAVRLLVQLTEKHLGQSMVITNVEGGASATGLVQVAQAKPDGYTIVNCTSTLSALKPQGRMPFGSEMYEPIIGFQANDYAIGVHKNSKFKSLKDLIDYAKANPGKVNIGVSAVGANTHLVAVALEMAAGVKFNMIPDPGGAAKGILEAAGGNLDAAAGGVNEFMAQIQAGNVKLLAVSGDKRYKQYPDVPAMKELGYDVDFKTCRFMLAPKGTPEPVIKTLHDAFKKGMDDPKFVDYIKQSASLEGWYYDYKQAKPFLKEQDEYYVKLLDKAGLTKKK